MADPKPLSIKHAAPGPYLGFALQPVRLCYHLLSSPAESEVSLEYLDDVAVHYKDGALLLEQCKSALSHNPISDWSPDLWNAICNWLDEVEEGGVDAISTAFHLYVTPAKEGKFSSALNFADGPETIASLVQLVSKKLKQRANPPQCIAHVEKFLATEESVRAAVIQRIKIIATDDDPLEPLRNLLRPTTPEKLVDIICASAIGQAKEAADRCIRQKAPAIINAADFRRNFHAFVQQNNMAGYLPSFTPAPSNEDTHTLLTGRPIFARQLQLVGASEETLIRAASDWMRTSGDKTKWASQGYVFEEAFEDWDKALLRQYQAVSMEVHEVFHEKNQDAQGRIIYSRCSQKQVALGGRTVPEHFTHGGFNDLADRRELGWHPRHQALLDDEEAK